VHTWTLPKEDLTLQNKTVRPRAYCKVQHSMCARYLGQSMWFIGIYQISSILIWTITINHNQALFVCCMVSTQNLLAQQEAIIRAVAQQSTDVNGMMLLYIHVYGWDLRFIGIVRRIRYAENIQFEK